MSQTRPVVVGVDGSPSSKAAAEYGAALAIRRNRPLALVYGYLSPYYAYYGPMGVVAPYGEVDTAARAEIDTELKQLVKHLREEHPALVGLHAEVINGGPAQLLIEKSAEAEATVVGCRGVGGFAELMLGSVSAQVSTHAHGPVIVVRPPVADDEVGPGPEQPVHPAKLGPVMAAVDGSPASEAVLRFAVTEAVQRNVPLIVTHVYWADPWKVDPDPTAAAAAEAWKMLAGLIEPWTRVYPDLDVDRRIVHGMNPGYSLIEASREAALLVVGCRGRGGFAGMLLGSVSRNLVHHSHCPVAVIHPTEH